MEEFQGELGAYQTIETEDGSTTFHSEYFNEAFHSRSGAVKETLHNYIIGCDIASKYSELEEFTIFEVGFGMGLGVELSYECLKEGQRPWTFISSEIDAALVRRVEKNHSFFSDFKWSNEGGIEIARLEKGNMKIIILIGDLRETLKKAYQNNFLNPFHVIYQDPFSPKRNQKLWTVEWFELLKKCSDKNVLMSTYSASISVRKSMLESGWQISSFKGFGAKRSCTRAQFMEKTDPLLVDQLSKTNALPLFDKDILIRSFK